MSDADVSRRRFLRGSAGGALAVALGGGLVTSGCTSVNIAARGDGGQLLDRLRDRGVVRMGFANERPFGYINHGGELTGQAPSVGKAVFRKLGIDEFEPKLADFGSLIPGLKAGLFDVIAAGMYITPPRCAEIEFSNPDYNAPEALLLPAGNPLGLTDLRSVRDHQSARIGVLTGSVEERYALALGIPRDRVVVFPDQASGIDGVLANRSDSLMLTRLSLNAALEERPGAALEISETFFVVIDGVQQNGAGGFGFRKGETDIVDAFNRELAAMKAQGEVLEIVQPFGFSKNEMTELTAQELCAAPEVV
ncbi:amino acid ABC transporter substrate-binding protein (PAAT family) [Amycolatopsis cihanbeyliensis]|uniref:Amino acid ABC transporter substrate-binding protein (PAAT family) n=1 Tax=Amycolatopsis cihanbeyliensis TaxID=1128664 RepID=A0A542DRQ5_AMYCI|nr:amino acid ABC transporter substrate-binding protein (PAAT family) [Amycolatopsis cihanbeyliensis]